MSKVVESATVIAFDEEAQLPPVREVLVEAPKPAVTLDQLLAEARIGAMKKKISLFLIESGRGSDVTKAMRDIPDKEVERLYRAVREFEKA